MFSIHADPLSLRWRLAVDPMPPGGAYDFWISRIFLPVRTPKSHNSAFSLSNFSQFSRNFTYMKTSIQPIPIPYNFPSKLHHHLVSQYQSPNFPTLTHIHNVPFKLTFHYTTFNSIFNIRSSLNNYH